MRRVVSSSGMVDTVEVDIQIAIDTTHKKASPDHTHIDKGKKKVERRFHTIQFL